MDPRTHQARVRATPNGESCEMSPFALMISHVVTQEKFGDTMNFTWCSNPPHSPGIQVRTASSRGRPVDFPGYAAHG